jgi:hypothetical protein
MPEIKIIDKSFSVSRKRGNGTLRYEVWKTDKLISRYNLAFINHRIYSGDNGRVLGYDNKHGHHRHYMGNIESVDSECFEEIEQRFEREWAAILEVFNAQCNR